MVGSLEPSLCFELLRKHCLPNMRPDEKRVLLRRAWTRTIEEIAEREHVSLSTAKHRLDQGLSLIFDTLPSVVPRDGYSAGTWVGCHLVCCLAEQVVELKREAGAA